MYFVTYVYIYIYVCVCECECVCVYIYVCMYVCIDVYVYNWATGLMSRVFANGLGDQGSIPGWVIPKTQKMVLDAALLINTQHYKVRIKEKMEQSRERSSALPYTSV